MKEKPIKDETYYEQLDKRTKEYKLFKEIKEKQIEEQSKGLGDVIENITEATGVKKAVNFLFGEDCGCGDRKDKINNLLPNTSLAVNCIEEEDYEYLKSFFSRPRTRVNRTQQVRLIEIYNYVYDKRAVPPTGCQGCSNAGFIKNVNKLHKYFDAAQELIDSSSSEE